ncbi:hypothetical protein [Mycobacterium deserti]|uniref:Serine/threonine protein kinase n=1 Tax=Mycobacterium deserti TaxID=2978347 RepID=A0ABT2MMD6_9MYCO|nr:hypothetical protein [Mycobacterium deserti]MCT7662131.1 hypothetical protein [Mycobacterium deserti]
MTSRPFRIVTAAAAVSALAATGLPAAGAAPATDAQGYVDSTARCATPGSAVLFGSTATSRVAICETPGGEFEYRGVRVRDGAKLIVPASQSGSEFTAENEGITYTVTKNALSVSAGSKVIREEAMVDFHEAQASPGPSPSPGPGPGPSPAETATPSTPLPPPLPAEVGGS